jgi:hypothetical protein
MTKLLEQSNTDILKLNEPTNRYGDDCKEKYNVTDLLDKLTVNTTCSHEERFGFCKFKGKCFEKSNRYTIKRRNTKNIILLNSEEVCKLFKENKLWRLISYYGFLGLVPDYKMSPESFNRDIFLKSDLKLPKKYEIDLMNDEERNKLFIGLEKSFKDYLSNRVDLVSTEELTSKKSDSFEKDYINVQLHNNWQKKAGLYNTFTFFVSFNQDNLKQLFVEKREGEMSVGVVSVPLKDLFLDIEPCLKRAIIENIEDLKLDEVSGKLNNCIDSAIEGKEFIHYHLKSVIDMILKGKIEIENSENMYCCIVVEYWPDKDMIVCSLTGGKRDLGETELESEIRENNEELGKSYCVKIFANSYTKKYYSEKSQNAYCVRSIVD